MESQKNEAPIILPGKSLVAAGFVQDNLARSLSFFRISDEGAVSDALIKELVELTEIRGDINARLCLHSSPKHAFQEMIIIEYKSFRFYRPHKHSTKQESLHLMDGELAVILFTDTGSIIKQYKLSIGNIEVLRIAANQWHAVIPLSDRVIYHESKLGPFEAETDSIYPDWAPTGSDINEASAYTLHITSGI